MGNIIPYRTAGLSRADSRKLKLFTQTVGKELVGAEIDEAIEWCEIYGANPFVRDIYFFVFDADKAERRVVPVLGIGLYRKIAHRSGNYRPDDRPARFTYDEKLKGPANPKGIVDCEMGVYVYSHGDWHYVCERIRWEERAPLKERWINNKPSGEFYIDAKKNKNWITMPETMMAKTVEAAVIRKAFPEETAGSYADGELDQAAAILDLSATEILEEQDAKDRFERIGGKDCLTVDWIDGSKLDRVPVGAFGDRVMEWLGKNDPVTIATFEQRNAETLKEYWARDKGGALALKQQFEKASQEVSA